MGTVYKRKGRNGKKLRNYTFAFFDHTGRRVIQSARTSDKRTAERILAEKEARVRGILGGAIDLGAEQFQSEARRTIKDTRKLYQEHFESKGKVRGHGKRSPTTIRDEKGHLELFFENPRATKLQTVGDLAASGFPKVVEAVAKGWVAGGLSGYTANQRIGAVRRFLSWCVDEGLLRDNPLKSWKPYAYERTRPRRALTDEEVATLLRVAKERGRLLWYLMAVRTGLRRAELQRLAWVDVDLAAEAIVIPASKSKSRREAALPLTRDLKEALLLERPEEPEPNQRVFPTIPTNATRVKDFERAGIAPEDEEGRHADFHSLRHTLGTTLARKGVAPQLAQEFMRHSDYRTTLEYYTHLRLEDLTKAAAVLEPDEVVESEVGEGARESA